MFHVAAVVRIGIKLHATIESLYIGPLYMNIEGRGVYKVTTIDLSWFPLSII